MFLAGRAVKVDKPWARRRGRLRSGATEALREPSGLGNWIHELLLAGLGTTNVIDNARAGVRRHTKPGHTLAGRIHAGPLDRCVVRAALRTGATPIRPRR